MSFIFNKLAIPDVVSITPKIFDDDRGYFFENFHDSIFSSSDFSSDLVVDLSLLADLEKYFPASTMGTWERG